MISKRAWRISPTGPRELLLEGIWIPLKGNLDGSGAGPTWRIEGVGVVALSIGDLGVTDEDSSSAVHDKYLDPIVRRAGVGHNRVRPRHPGIGRCIEDNRAWIRARWGGSCRGEQSGSWRRGCSRGRGGRNTRRGRGWLRCWSRSWGKERRSHHFSKL